MSAENLEVKGSGPVDNDALIRGMDPVPQVACTADTDIAKQHAVTSEALQASRARRLERNEAWALSEQRHRCRVQTVPQSSCQTAPTHRNSCNN